MLYQAFLGLHIAAGVLGLIIGFLAFRPPDDAGGRFAAPRVYAGTLSVLVAAVLAAIATHWSSLDALTRAVFAGLGAFGAVVVTRGLLALRLAARQPRHWRASYINHIYFTYISLWEALVIVGLLDLGAPAWLVPIVAVGVLALGGYLLARYRRRVTTSPPLRRGVGAIRQRVGGPHRTP